MSSIRWFAEHRVAANLIMVLVIGGGLITLFGVPLPGCELKLVPDDDMRCEVRVRGPQLCRGYLDASLDAEAFGFWLKAAFGAPTTTAASVISRMRSIW